MNLLTYVLTLASNSPESKYIDFISMTLMRNGLYIDDQTYFCEYTAAEVLKYFIQK
jgi:hypothetical protein